MVLIFYNIFFNKQNSEFLTNTFNLNFSRFKWIYYLVTFFVLIFFQISYIKFETISWDISSYLVASQELDSGNLPFTTQWESKGPLMYYVYNLFSKVSNKNYIIFKLINDVILLLILLNLNLYINKYTKNKILNFISSLFFIVIFSSRWFVSEYTEIYCLFLISIVLLLDKSRVNQQIKFFNIGLLFSLSVLINQGSVIIFLGYFLFYFNKFKLNKIKEIFNLSFGFILPLLFTTIIYFNAGMIKVLLANYIYIPLGYSSSAFNVFYESKVYLRELFQYNVFLFFIILSSIIFILFEFLTEKLNKEWKSYFDLDIILLFFSFLYFVLGGHGYAHHLIYFTFFFCIFIIKLNTNKFISFIFIISILSFVQLTFTYSKSSLYSLKSLNEIYQNYPLKLLAEEIKYYFPEENFNVLALDYVLVLFYLDKPNYSYIVHPTNHFQKYITQSLIEADVLTENELNEILNHKPDVIICNTKAIDIGGKVISYDPIYFGKTIEENQENSCSLAYLGEDYFQLDTEKYRKSKNLSFYLDPYKEMNVFIFKGF